VLYIADPGWLLSSPFFRLKIAMLAVALLNTWLLHAVLFRSVDRWNTNCVPPPLVRVSGAASLVLWGAIVVFSMMTPYFNFD
jgi:hypothetical protein